MEQHLWLLLVLVKENDKGSSIIRMYPPFDIISFNMYVKYLYLCQEKKTFEKSLHH